MPGFLTRLASFNGRRSARVATLAADDPSPVLNETTGKQKNCRRRLAAAPWSSFILGDDPIPLVLLLIFALVLRPLMTGIELALGLLLVVAVLLRVWQWCRASQRTDET